MDRLIALYSRFDIFVRQNANALMFVLGACLLMGGVVDLSLAGGAGDFDSTGSYSQANYDDTLVRNAVGNLFGFVEGAFGALIMVVSGLAAIAAAAMGAYRASIGMLVVAVGAFILRALVSVFFGTNFETEVMDRPER